jgi:zinc protease
MTTTNAAVRPPRPLPAPPRPYHFPPFERRELPNGMRIIVANVPKLPVATFVLLADAGAVTDLSGREGLAQLTAQLLLEGTTDMDGAALTERLELLGAAASASADWDTAIVRCTALADRLPEAVGILARVLREPAFPEREVTRLKAERISDLLQMRADPGALADRTFAQAVYAADSRYATWSGGTELSVQAISRDDVAAFHVQRYRPSGMTIVIAGAMTLDEGERLVRDTFGTWHGEAPPAVVASDEPASRARRVHLVARPDAPQSELRVGHVGVPRTHPDYFEIVVMNAILGGLFSSRINLNLREAHGYTYGAHSGFDWRRQAGPFGADAAVKSEVTADAIREILAEIDRMRAEPVTAAELSLATSYLDGVFPIRYETTDAIAAAIANLVVHGLGDDWLDRYRERVRAVTIEGVLHAAQAHLHPESLQVVVVGDPAVVRGPVEALGLGDVIDTA